MAKRHLTDAAVERIARPAHTRMEVSDTEPGLFLRVSLTGVKSWLVIYRLSSSEGKRTERRRTIVGRFPDLGVAEARSRARQLMRLAREGVDPVSVRASEIALATSKAAEERANSFQAIANDYIAAMLAGQLVGGRKRAVTKVTAIARKRLLQSRVLSRLGDVSVANITTPQIASLLAEIEGQNGPVDETLKVIRGVFKFALTRGRFTGPLPTAGLTNRQPPKKVTRSLTDSELRRIWNAAGRQGWPFGSIIRLLMLTGQRKNEIAGLRWREVDLDRKLLVLPAERVKNRKGNHEVALTELALEVLRDARERCLSLIAVEERKGPPPPNSLVFPSDTRETPVSGWNRLKATMDRIIGGSLAGVTPEEWRSLRAGGAVTDATKASKRSANEKIAAVQVEPWRLHDLRHTFITRCRDGDENAEGEVVWSAPIDVLQATVNHEITVGVTKAYDHGDLQRRYRLRKRELMEWWARKLSAIVE